MGAGTGTMFWPLGSGAGCQRRAGPTRTIGITARSRPSRGGTHAASTRGGGGGGRRGAGPGLMAFRAVPGPAASRFGQSAWDKWELTSNWQWHPGSRLEMIPFPTRGGWWRRWGRGRVGVGNQRPWEGWVGGDVVNSPWWSEDGRWKNWNGENALGLVSRCETARVCAPSARLCLQLSSARWRLSMLWPQAPCGVPPFRVPPPPGHWIGGSSDSGLPVLNPES